MNCQIKCSWKCIWNKTLPLYPRPRPVCISQIIFVSFALAHNYIFCQYPNFSSFQIKTDLDDQYIQK